MSAMTTTMSNANIICKRGPKKKNISEPGDEEMALVLAQVGAVAFTARALWDIYNLFASKKEDFSVSSWMYGVLSSRIKDAVDNAIQQGVIDVSAAIGEGIGHVSEDEQTGIAGAIATGVVGVGGAFASGSGAIARSIDEGATDMGEAFAGGMTDMFAPVVTEVEEIETNVERTDVALRSIAAQATPGARLLDMTISDGDGTGGGDDLPLLPPDFTGDIHL